MKNRKIGNIISEKIKSRFGRIIVLTGARQIGKTTLVRKVFPEYVYISIEDPVLRPSYLDLSAAQWKTLYPKAILDEVQKEPQIIESIKSTYDQWEEPRYVLLGSSQLLLMEKVRESLAGRASIFEMFTLTLPEMRTNSWNDEVENSIFLHEMRTNPVENNYLPSFLLDGKMAEKQLAYEKYLETGGYPAISGNDITPDEKYDWLDNYVKTYLERDIRELASFRELEPFVQLQQYLALNTSCIINASSVSKQLGVSVKTVQRYLKYVEISYQGILLQAWTKNQNKRLMKAPKFHYLDNGVVQAVLHKRGGLTGGEYESAIVSEIYRQLKTEKIQPQIYYLRTYDGKEIDLLLEFPDFYYAFEIKMAAKVSRIDAKHLFDLEKILDKPLRKAFVLSNDNETKIFDDKIVAVNAAMFLG